LRARGTRNLAALLLYGGVSFAYFGWPLAAHPGRELLGTSSDPEIFVWAFAWWPHAILHGINPFVTHALYAPAGANLAWTTSVPGLALAFSPLTLLFGPVVAFNVAALVLPALSAWSAYLLCLALTRSAWAALVGGYLFGFSSFVLSEQLEGHLMLTGAFLLPLVALTLLRFNRGELSRRASVARLAVLLAAQAWVSTEVALTEALMLVLALALAWLLVSDSRAGVRALAVVLTRGYCLAALLAAPLIAYLLVGFQAGGFVGGALGTDAVNLLMPASYNAIVGSSLPTIQGFISPHESALYLGPPTLLIVALYAWRNRRLAWSRFLVVAFALAVLLALGPALLVDGRDLMPLPWALLQDLPGLDNVRTPRLGEYVALIAAVVVALWIAQARGRIYQRPYVLPILAVVALVPAAWNRLAVQDPTLPTFFTSGLYRACLGADATIAVFPFDGGLVDLAQAEGGFRFRVAGGYLTPPVFGQRSVVSFNQDPTVVLLNFYADRGQPSTAALLAFAARHGVEHFVALAGSDDPTEQQLRTLGPSEEVGGVLVTPACHAPPLTSRPVRLAEQVVNAEQESGATILYCLGGYSYELPAGLEPGVLLRGATRAFFVAGSGLSCSAPPGYRKRGYAPVAFHVPADTYAYYVR
jgi:hypothetical protein